MASNMQDTEEFTIEELKKQAKVTDEQLDTRIEQHELPVLAGYFDNANDGYLVKMNLPEGQQTDVRTRAYVDGTLAGMLLALQLWLKCQLRTTFRALIIILLSLGKNKVAMKVFKYLSKEDFTLPSPLQERKKEKKVSLYKNYLQSRSLQERKLKVSSYRDYLQSRYRAQTLTSMSQWPPIRANKIIQLAIIQKEKIQSGKSANEFVRLTITGKIDDILHYKTHVELKNIFFDNQDRKKFVLIEGAPGSGKSTLALHICQEWAKGRLFQEFDIAVLVRLRDPLIRDAMSIADILPCTNKKMANDQENVIISLYGKGVLWVLDGWDELPSGLPQNSIINKLIRPGISRESPVHESTVIVTSRPSSSAELHPLVSSRVEVLGFTPLQLERYFIECLNGDSQAVQTLLDRIRENPVVEGNCYLPLNASIVVHCFLSDNHSLPISNHGIFTSVVQSSLKRYLQDKLGKSTPVGNITSPDSLPSELRTPFVEMCRLAYYGIDQNKATFTDEDLSTLSISKDISDVGLVQTVPSIISDGHLVYYSFLHLSIQELLAAIHISLMSPKDQISVFQNLFGKPRFNAVFQFYAGITNLTTKRPFLSKVPRLLCPVPASMFDLVRNIIRSECEKFFLVPKPRLLSLVNCLYETEDLSLCAFVADTLNHKLILAYTPLNPIDCLSVGRFASNCINTNGKLGLNLTNCYIGNQGCKFLARGLSKCIHSPANLTLNLYSNNIGNSGLSTICECLSTNTSLKTLELSNCSLVISVDTGAALYQLLSENNSLEDLDLSHNIVTSCHHIAAGLAVNKTLKILNLADCKLTDRSIGELLTGLINNIESLNIKSTHWSMTNKGVKMLARHLTTHCPRLNTLYIYEYSSDHIQTVFRETNKERIERGFEKIVVHIVPIPQLEDMSQIMSLLKY